MYQILFIHSSVDGHLGFLHVLAIVNGAAVNIGMHVSFWIIILSGYMPIFGYLDLCLQKGLFFIYALLIIPDT